MNAPDISKLPKWAQEHINGLQRQRDAAVKALNESLDTQTKTGIYIDSLECTGEQQGPSHKRRFIQGEVLNFAHAGILLRVSIYQPDKIQLQWDVTDRTKSRDVAMIPQHYCGVDLIAKENMR